MTFKRIYIFLVKIIIYKILEVYSPSLGDLSKKSYKWFWIRSKNVEINQQVIKMKCKHNFVRSGYGNDLICTKCGYAAMQAVATMPVKESIQEPVLREKMKVSLNTGDGTEMVLVYRDEFEKELQRALGLDFSYNIMQNAMKNSR